MGMDSGFTAAIASKKSKPSNAHPQPKSQKRKTAAEPAARHSPPASFEPIVTYISRFGTKTCEYMSSDGCIYKHRSTPTAYTPFKVEPRLRNRRQNLSAKHDATEQAEITPMPNASHATKMQLRSEKTARTLFMEFYRESCRIWYHKESTGVVEGRLANYLVT